MYHITCCISHLYTFMYHITCCISPIYMYQYVHDTYCTYVWYHMLYIIYYIYIYLYFSTHDKYIPCFNNYLFTHVSHHMLYITYTYESLCICYILYICIISHVVHHILFLTYHTQDNPNAYALSQTVTIHFRLYIAQPMCQHVYDTYCIYVSYHMSDFIVYITYRMSLSHVIYIVRYLSYTISYVSHSTYYLLPITDPRLPLPIYDSFTPHFSYHV